MTQAFVTGLFLSNILTLGALGYFYNENTKANSLRTTDTERATHGQACVDWITDDAKAEGHDNAAFKLARSWRKHGQMVFEIVPDWENKEFKSEEALCVIDEQSGMYFRYAGRSRNPWLFYE